MITPPETMVGSSADDLVEPLISVWESDSDSDVPLVHTSPSTPVRLNDQGISVVVEAIQARTEHLSVADEPAHESSSPPAAQGSHEQPTSARDWAQHSHAHVPWPFLSSTAILDGNIVYNLDPTS